MTTIVLDRIGSREAARRLIAEQATPEDWDVLLGPAGGQKRVYGADGSLVCVYLPGALLGDPAFDRAYPVLHGLKLVSDNRPQYGKGNENERDRGQQMWATGTLRYRETKLDGTVSRQNRGTEVRSGIIGYYGRSGRHPYCRETAFTARQTEQWADVVPLCRALGGLMRDNVRKRAKVQAEFVRAIPQAYRIADSPFTTMTVNNSVAAGYHPDAGDLKAGFGVMCYARRGSYQGGVLCFPRHRVAVDAHDGDVLLFNPHLVHGMSPLHGVGPKHRPEEGGWERLSLVLYARENMAECLEPEAERARANRRAEELANREAWA